MAMREPRTSRASASLRPSRSAPSRVIASAVTWPGGSGTSRMMESAVTLLALPLSPTSTRISPSSRSNETPFTDRPMPRSVANRVLRLRTLSRGIASALGLADGAPRAPGARVEGVAQAVAHEVDAEHAEHDGAGRRQEHPGRIAQEAPRFAHVAAPARLRRLRAEAEKAQRRLGHDRRGEDDGELDDDGRHDVAQQMRQHDAGGAGAERPRGRHIDILAHRERAAA